MIVDVVGAYSYTFRIQLVYAKTKDTFEMKKLLTIAECKENLHF